MRFLIIRTIDAALEGLLFIVCVVDAFCAFAWRSLFLPSPPRNPAPRRRGLLLLAAILTAALVAWTCIADAEPLKVQEAVGAFKIASPEVVRDMAREIMPEIKKELPSLQEICGFLFAVMSIFALIFAAVADHLIRTQRKHTAALEAISLHLGRRSSNRITDVYD